MERIWIPCGTVFNEDRTTITWGQCTKHVLHFAPYNNDDDDDYFREKKE